MYLTLRFGTVGCEGIEHNKPRFVSPCMIKNIIRSGQGKFHLSILKFEGAIRLALDYYKEISGKSDKIQTF